MSMFSVRLPGEDDPRRLAVREWISDHPSPTGRELLDSGYMVPHWAPPWGLGAGALHTYIISDELRRANIERPQYAINRDYAAPLIFGAGTDAQRERHLAPMLAGEEVWCQLFSEPGAGSDLASLTTRAVRDGDEYIVNGQKTWSSHAHVSDFGILLVRTDPTAAKHRGISYLICPMKTPGITLTPIYSMDGKHHWNITFFNDVRIPVENRIGEENKGWGLARETLANERMSMSSGEGLSWGHGPTFSDLRMLIRGMGGLRKRPEERQRFAQGYVDAMALHVLQMRALSRVQHAQSEDLVPEVRRALGDAHGRRRRVADRLRDRVTDV